MCKYCGKRRALNNGVTCGNSYCQEANYHDNAARCLGKGKRKQAQREAYRARQAECEALAARWPGRV
jgi:hypothetical protein